MLLCQLYDKQCSILFNFQGSERDIIIVSCVRTFSSADPDGAVGVNVSSATASAGVAAGPTASVIGFLDDPRRMNVALTRAKFASWVIGSAHALETGIHWRAFIAHCSEAGCIVPVEDAATFKFDNAATAAGVTSTSDNAAAAGSKD